MVPQYGRYQKSKLGRHHKQYKYNIEVNIARRDLETTKQDPKESFSTFITKWKSKATQMINKPNEKEQLTMVEKISC